MVPTQIQKATTQAQDQCGNVTTTNVYDYGKLNYPARIYGNTYITDANYTARRIYNRLLYSAVNGVTLALNYYDGSCGGSSAIHDVPGMLQHDGSFSTTFTYRGNLSSTTAPGSTTCHLFDIGGNVVSTTNGVTSTSTLTSATDFAAPSQITTNSLTTTLNWTPFLGLYSQGHWLLTLVSRF